MNTIKIELTAEQINAIKNGVSTIELVQKEEVTGQPEPMSLKHQHLVDKVNIHNAGFWVTTPTTRDAVKARALTQLLTVMHYANGGEWVPKGDEDVYEVFCDLTDKELDYCDYYGIVSGPVYFKTLELAKQAANDNRDLFIQYFTGEEVTSEQ
jgi:hypothetical protein